MHQDHHYFPHERHAMLAMTLRFDDAPAGPARVADAIVFSYLTIRGSGLNVPDEARTRLLVQLRDVLAQPTVDPRRSRRQGMVLASVDPTGGPFFAA